jgi:hypothetical protein
MNRFQMISDNSGVFKEATVTLSTIEMPKISGFDLGYTHESCLFSHGESEVLARYQTRSDAIVGHITLEKKFSLS